MRYDPFAKCSRFHNWQWQFHAWFASFACLKHQCLCLYGFRWRWCWVFKDNNSISTKIYSLAMVGTDMFSIVGFLFTCVVVLVRHHRTGKASKLKHAIRDAQKIVCYYDTCYKHIAYSLLVYMPLHMQQKQLMEHFNHASNYKFWCTSKHKTPVRALFPSKTCFTGNRLGIMGHRSK